MDFSLVEEIEIPEGAVKKITEASTGNVLWEKHIPFTGLKFTAEEADAEIGASGVMGSMREDLDLKYSLDDGRNWNSWDGSTITLANIGDAMCIKGDNPGGVNSGNIMGDMRFTTSKKVAASGNINSLLDDGDGSTITAIPSNYCYNSLFSNTKITSIPELPATTLTNYCYYQLFVGCRQLTSIPEGALPATNLTDGCYSNMFSQCSAIETVPLNLLPVTTLATNCYQMMFYFCSSLTQAPSLPATTLANRCYNSMFGDCTNLKIKENNSTGSTKIFTCPSTSGISAPVASMFDNTGGSFTGTPTTGNTYYWYT